MAKREFMSRRLHSLLGVIPIGIFLVQHLIINHFAVYGEERFNQAVQFMESMPFLIVLEIFVILLPILYHAVLGIYIAFTARNNVGRYGYVRNILFYLQRVTGFTTFVFIIWHVWETRIQVAIGHVSVDYSMMATILANKWMFGFYLVGVISAVFHFANGLWSFFVTWGITQSRHSQRIMTYITLMLFVVISYIGIRALFSFI